MTQEWHTLTELTRDKDFIVTGVRMTDSDVTINGEFELPVLATLRYEDQVFVGEFVRCHGSIKQMEKAFGVSYPTIKSRLNRIADRLQLVHIEPDPSPETSSILDRLEKGDITVEEAAEGLRRDR